MPSARRTVYSVSVGEPPRKRLKTIETVKLIIYDIRNRKEKHEEYIKSPNVKAHGFEWDIDVYPRGDNDTNENLIASYLTLRSYADVTVSVVWRCNLKVRMDDARYTKDDSFGEVDFEIDRGKIGPYLEDDNSLVIEVDIKLDAINKCVWFPKEYQPKHKDLYEDASSDISDVAFSVEGEIYKAHKSILALRCKKLYEIAKESDNDVPIPIHSERGIIFKGLLDFVYHVKTPTMKTEAIALEFLVAADRFDFPDLKLYAESVIVLEFLTVQNAAAMFIFADSHSCALLKEESTKFFVTDRNSFKKGESWSKIKESPELLEGLLDGVANRVKPDKCQDSIDLMDVTTLRKELDDANLQLDGSREILVERLKAHRLEADSQKTETNDPK